MMKDHDPRSGLDKLLDGDPYELIERPPDCPRCGGHGGSTDEGDCATCQGSGVDPADPASPL